MKTLQFELPEQMAKELERLVRGGWFASEAELARIALSEFLRRNQFQLQEQFQRDDIQWALNLKKSAP